MSPEVHLPPYTPIVVHALAIGLGHKWPQMAKKIGKQKNFLPPNEVRQHAPMAQVFFSLLEGLLGCWIFVVPKVFSQSSHCVPQVPIVFPNMFPIASSLYLISLELLFVYLFIYLH